MPENCVFCNLADDKKIVKGEHAFVIEDVFPVTKYHSLVIPNRHFENFFDITDDELLEINRLLKIRKQQILEQDSRVEGFNVGINIGLVAG